MFEVFWQRLRVFTGGEKRCGEAVIEVGRAECGPAPGKSPYKPGLAVAGLVTFNALNARFLELASVLVGVNHVASFIENANHGIV